MIDYKSFDEQIEILKKRNLIIDDDLKVKRVLQKENYYNVINGYKDKFILDCGTQFERFKKDVSFWDVYTLYQFDRDLRTLFLKKILVIENSVKSIIAHIFAKHHKEDGYLKEESFGNANVCNLKYSVKKVIEKIKESIKNQIQNGNKMIIHYKNKYGFIPMWVLVNILSLGEISKFFSIMQEKEQREVCVELSQIFDKKIYIPDMRTYLGILTQVRNICAHDQRLYDFSSNLNISSKNELMKVLKISKAKGILSVIICLNQLMPKPEFQEFRLDFVKILSTLDSIKSINKSVIIKSMGLDKGFDNLFDI